jgi:hypothetical protein
MVAVVIAGILTLSVLAAMSSTNQVFAQARRPTFLSMITYPCCSSNIHPSVPTVGASFSGKLNDSEDSGVGGATIHLIGVPGFWFDTTNSYTVRADLAPGTYHIHTHYGGDSDYESSDSRTITYTVTH